MSPTNAMPGMVYLDKLEVPNENYLRDINDRRHKGINLLWEQYQGGTLELCEPRQRSPGCELIRAADLLVNIGNHPDSGKLHYIDVSNRANLRGVNFMGYCPERDCLAFRGEARHFATFCDFASSIIKEDHVKVVFKAPSEIRPPYGGLPPGLNYNDFAGRVEIVEYAMWINPQDDEDDEDDDQGWTVTVMEVDDTLNSVHEEPVSEPPSEAATEPASPQTPEPMDLKVESVKTELKTENPESQIDADAVFAAELAAMEENMAARRYGLRRTRQRSNSPPPKRAKVAKKGVAVKKGVAKKKAVRF